MKYLIALFLVLSLSCCAQMELSVRQDMYDNPKFDSGPGVMVKSVSENGMFVGFGYQQTSRKEGGQLMYNVDIGSLVVGMQHELELSAKNRLTISGCIGYYQPQLSFKNSTVEAIRYYAEDATNTNHSSGWNVPGKNPYKWSYQTADLHGGPGGQVGIDFIHQFSRKWSVGIGLGYRFLELYEEIRMRDPLKKYSFNTWEFKQTQDLSGGSASITIAYEF